MQHHKQQQSEKDAQQLSEEAPCDICPETSKWYDEFHRLSPLVEPILADIVLHPSQYSSSLKGLVVFILFGINFIGSCQQLEAMEESAHIYKARVGAAPLSSSSSRNANNEWHFDDAFIRDHVKVYGDMDQVKAMQKLLDWSTKK